MGYSQWRSFEQVVEKAILACHNSGYEPGDHFARVRKMVEIGSGAERAIDDIALSRFACYLVAQNGDSNKEQIAFAQTYFAVQTRKMEVIEQRLGENQSFARIRSKADSALFGGLSCTIRFSTTDKANYLHGF